VPGYSIVIYNSWEHPLEQVAIPRGISEHVSVTTGENERGGPLLCCDNAAQFGADVELYWIHAHCRHDEECVYKGGGADKSLAL
jgi:hypothetical protein